MASVMVAAADRTGLKSLKKDKTVNMRIKDQQLQLIDKAAEVVGRKRTEFVIEAAYREAQSILLEQTFLVYSDEEWKGFSDALSQPPKYNEKLAKLLSRKSLWENYAPASGAENQPANKNRRASRCRYFRLR